MTVASGALRGLRVWCAWGRWRRLAAACVLGLLAGSAAAEPYKGPITLVVGYPAGGSADIGARILAEKLPALLGQPVIVENRAGAGGQIAARYVKAASPNGSVLFFTNGHTVVTVPLVLKAPGFDTRADLQPVSPFASFELVLAAHAKTGAHDVKQLAAYFAANPRERNIAVPAPGSAPEFLVGRLAQLTGTDLQPIAYKGSGPAVQDLLGGQVAAAVVPVSDVLQYRASLQLLAVTRKTALLPDVPSFADAGMPELAASDFLAVYAPHGMAADEVARIHAAVQKVVAMPDVSRRMLSYALQPQVGTPADLERTFTASQGTVRSLMTAVNYKPQ
ncbi:tripartite tricarboxylate transporter substrate-binding protein [Variovorax sp. RCC_210]|uniref:tripartite tricarboxylate transporter substrate-binding protein n=1 Tax=Variovorax sp. RCC_210 TaxID=3239217 RepID=UPI003523D51A